MDELERFKREIHLGDLAKAQGYQLDRRESSRSSLVLRHPDGDKIIVATDEDGHGVFFSVHGHANGSLIDFLMHRRGINLGQARKLLREWLPDSSSPTAPSSPRVRQLPIPQPMAHDRVALVAHWHSLSPYTGGYLEARGLKATTLAVFSDRIRTDQRENLAFRHDDWQGLSGWELKNWGFHGFAIGGSKAFFGVRAEIASKVNPPRLVVTESAIDAMSFYQANPGPGLYLSLAGSVSPKQQALLAEVLIRYPQAEVLAATDNDPQGEHYAALIQAIRPDTVRWRSPVGKDWNDAIRPV